METHHVAIRVDDESSVVTVRLEHAWLELSVDHPDADAQQPADIPRGFRCGVHLDPTARIAFVAYCSEHADVVLQVRDGTTLTTYHVLGSAPEDALRALVAELVLMERNRRAAAATAAATATATDTDTDTAAAINTATVTATTTDTVIATNTHTDADADADADSDAPPPHDLTVPSTSTSTSTN